MVMQEMSLEAWRDAALPAAPPPLNAVDEAVTRQRLREQCSRIIQRSDQLRMLLDSYLTRLFDPWQMAVEQFGAARGDVEDMADVYDSASVSSSHDESSEDISEGEAAEEAAGLAEEQKARELEMRIQVDAQSGGVLDTGEEEEEVSTSNSV